MCDILTIRFESGQWTRSAPVTGKSRQLARPRRANAREGFGDSTDDFWGSRRRSYITISRKRHPKHQAKNISTINNQNNNQTSTPHPSTIKLNSTKTDIKSEQPPPQQQAMQQANQNTQNNTHRGKVKHLKTYVCRPVGFWSFSAGVPTHAKPTETCTDTLIF